MQTPRSAASQFRVWGASVTAIGDGDKAPIHKWKRYYDTPQTEQDARGLPWNDAVGCGVLNGPGGWRTFDTDPRKTDAHGEKLPLERIQAVPAEVVDTILQKLGLPLDYRWVWRSSTGKGWEVAFICHDELPANVLTVKATEPGVFWGLAKDGTSFDHIELRWDRNQTIYPPSQSAGEGPGYRWRGEAPDAAPAVVSIGHVLAAFFAVAVLKPSEPKIAATSKPKRQESTARPASDREAIDEIKRRFDLLAFARKHWPGETQKERNGEIRILGHGGLLIDEEQDLWSCFRDEVGGDAIELIGYHLYGERFDHDDGTMFRAALVEGARETGVELPAPISASQTEQGATFTIDTATPEAAAREIERLRTENTRLQAQVAHLEGWQKWALEIAKLDSKRLSPAAKVVALSMYPEMKSRESRGVDEPQRLYIGDPKKPDDNGAARKAGLSAGTFGARLIELENAGAIARVEDRQENGHKRVLVQPTAVFLMPETWGPEQPRAHGGKRPGAGRPVPECPTCPPETPFEERTITTTAYHCGGCGTPLRVDEPKTSRRTWQPNTQDECWESQPHIKNEPKPRANPQLARIREDGGFSPITQVECWPTDEPEEANNQVECWVDPDAAPKTSTAHQPILLSRYKAHAAQRARAVTP